jgi:putative tricarboxylic transport membrane protein
MDIRWTLIALALTGPCTAGWAQGWTPQRNVEIVVSSVPGGSNDKTARTVERILVANKLMDATITVVNKPGGGGNIALTYLIQRPADGHTVMVATPAVLISHITGARAIGHNDLTPIASLFNDYTVFAVSSVSSIKTGDDLLGRLRKDPKSVPIGLGGSVGGLQHLPAALLTKAVGGNFRDLKVVGFKGSAEAVTNLLGGHVDLVPTAGGNAAPHLATGKLRVIGVAAPKRFGGTLAHAPTWKEQGVDVVWSSWRGIMGPKGLSAAQIAFWESALRKAAEYPEWKADIEKNFWSDDFTTGAQFRKDLDSDYANMKAVLVDLGLAK